jgi:hypothetical protein
MSPIGRQRAFRRDTWITAPTSRGESNQQGGLKVRTVRYLAVLAALILVIGACSDDDAGTTTDAPATSAATATTDTPATTDAPATTEAGEDHEDAGLTMEAPAAAITVDGDASDWDGIDGLDLTLEGIEGEEVDPNDVNVKVAHDDENLYMMFEVSDDYDFNIDDHHFSPAIGVMWAIDSEAGPHMGSDAEGAEDSYISLGMVDIWHWELDCLAGEGQGGAVSGPGDGTAGNDAACNLDDEYATDPETREDDDTASAENSLLGVFDHSNPVADGDGTWFFEMSRPLDTGDAQDARFTVGDHALLALAYWDPDFSFEGWDDASHVQSSSQGWIEVHLEEGEAAAMRTLEAPLAEITVDLDMSDWDGIDGLDMTLVAIEGEEVDSQEANVKVAHDGEFLYMLFSVPDDYDFNIDDHKFSPALGVMWAIDTAAGPHMGSGTEDGEGPSLGMVDIWHWELDCDFGVEQGGRVSGPGEGNPAGNDAGCNMDDEYSTDPETREDDGKAGEAGAENSLLGVWMHTGYPVSESDGTWYFEMSRPLQTGDAQDAQFTVGGTGLLAMAYWDPDVSFEGWDDATHVQSSSDGWIKVALQRN